MVSQARIRSITKEWMLRRREGPAITAMRMKISGLCLKAGISLDELQTFVKPRVQVLQTYRTEFFAHQKANDALVRNKGDSESRHKEQLDALEMVVAHLTALQMTTREHRQALLQQVKMHLDTYEVSVLNAERAKANALLGRKKGGMMRYPTEPAQKELKRLLTELRAKGLLLDRHSTLKLLLEPMAEFYYTYQGDLYVPEALDGFAKDSLLRTLKRWVDKCPTLSAYFTDAPKKKRARKAAALHLVPDNSLESVAQAWRNPESI